MINRTVIALCLIFMYSCKPEEEWLLVEKPASLIEENTLSSIIIDLHLLESAQSMNIIQPRDSNGIPIPLEKNKYQERVFVKYGTSRAAFDSSMLYYSKKPEVLTRIYEESLNEISRIQASVSK